MKKKTRQQKYIDKLASKGIKLRGIRMDDVQYYFVKAFFQIIRKIENLEDCYIIVSDDEKVFTIKENGGE